MSPGSTENEGLIGQLAALLGGDGAVAVEVAKDVGEEFTKQASQGVAKLPARIGKAVFTAITKQIKSSRAHRKFTSRWESAATRIEQEAAVKDLLESDPKLAGVLLELVYQRDYLIAVKTHCERLPFAIHAFAGSFSEDIFVDLPLHIGDSALARDIKPRVVAASQFIEQVLANRDTTGQGANYACFGGPGAGKTTLCRMLAAAYCEQILTDPDKVGDTKLVLPAFVRADDLAAIEGPFDDRLKAAIERALGPSLKSSLDAGLLRYRTAGRTRRWLVLIDGLDEIADQATRRDLVHAIRRAHVDVSDTCRFFLTCRNTAMAEEVFGSSFEMLHLDNLSEADASALFEKYSHAFGRTVQRDVFSRPPLNHLQPMLVTPLLVAIAATVLPDSAGQYSTLADLFEDFVRSSLTERGFSAAGSTAMRELLSDLAEAGAQPMIDRGVRGRSEQLGVIEPGLPSQTAIAAVTDRLIASGLVQVRRTSVLFIHASFRLFFRAQRFAAMHEPHEAIWEEIDPFKNGWDFAQFVLEIWQAKGVELSGACRNLLSYGFEGLQLLSRLIAQMENAPDSLVTAVIAKWRQILEDDDPVLGPFDAAVPHLSLMARRHAAALEELQQIASQPEGRLFSHVSFDAARHLADLGRAEAARDILLKTARHGYSMHRPLAAQALCDIGFVDDGLTQLHELLRGTWMTQHDDELSDAIHSIVHVHEGGQQQFALQALTTLARREDLSQFDADVLAQAVRKVAGDAPTDAFLANWLAQQPQYGPDIFSAVLEGKNCKLARLLPPNWRDAPTSISSLQDLCDRLTALPTEAQRLSEVVRNSYIDANERQLAVQCLAGLSDTDYSGAALHLIGDPNAEARYKRPLVEELRSRGLETDVIAALNSCAARRATAYPKDAELLIRAGARPTGIRLLESIAADPQAEPSTRAKAISSLADFGAADAALKYFRTLLATRTCVASAFESMAKRLRVTQHASAVDELSWRTLRQRAQPAGVRLVIAKLLYSPELPQDQHGVISRFLERMASRKRTVATDRFEALDQLFELDPDAFRICLELVDDVAAPIDVRMEAASRAERWGDGITTVSFFRELAWDEQLDVSQRVWCLVEIRDDLEEWPKAYDEDNIQEDVDRELQRIAMDSSVEPAIRLQALALPPRDSRPTRDRSADDSWPPQEAVDLFLHDPAVASRLKQECVVRLYECSPTLASSYVDHLENDSEDIDLALRSLYLLKTDHEDRALRLAMKLIDKATITVSNRLRAIATLYPAITAQQAEELISRIVRNAQGELTVSASELTRCASFLMEHRREQAGLKLIEGALAAPARSDDDFLVFAHFLATEGYSIEARMLLQSKLRNEAIDPQNRLLAAAMLFRLGETDAAFETNTDVAGDVASDPSPAKDLRELIRFEKWEKVASAIENWRARLDDDESDLMDAFPALRETPLEGMAKIELRRFLAESTDAHDRIQAAGILRELGDVDTARDTLISLSQDMTLDSTQRLLVAADLIAMDYDELAWEQLCIVAARGDSLSADDRELLAAISSNYAGTPTGSSAVTGKITASDRQAEL